MQFFCRDANHLIKQFDKPGVLQYLDPPYVSSTRVAEDVYAHEMDDEQQRQLLDVLLVVKNAKIILSGYGSELYDSALSNWRRETYEIDRKGSDSKSVATEVLWMNY